MEKNCSNCEEVKSVELFNKDKKILDGLCSYCKKCNNLNRNKNQRSFKGKLLRVYGHMITSQERRTKNSGIKHLVLFTKKEFVEWGLKHPDYIQLHQKWVKSDYKKDLSPSFDKY